MAQKHTQNTNKTKRTRHLFDKSFRQYTLLFITQFFGTSCKGNFHFSCLSNAICCKLPSHLNIELQQDGRLGVTDLLFIVFGRIILGNDYRVNLVFNLRVAVRNVVSCFDSMSQLSSFFLSLDLKKGEYAMYVMYYP